jgi:hypothetical protein
MDMRKTADAMRQATAAARALVLARNRELVVGRTYFLSHFYDLDGSFVVVESVSDAENRAGWPSTVTVRVVEHGTDDPTSSSRRSYPVGRVTTVNSTNLYETRESASAAARLRRR